MNRWKTGFVILMSCMLLSACDSENSNSGGPNSTPGPTPVPTPNQNQNPSLSGMSPGSGKAGTEVTITGKNLAGTTQVCFGEACVTPKQIEAEKVVASAPENKGMVVVTVKVGAATLTAGQFSYLDVSPNQAEIDWCKLTYVESFVESGGNLAAYAEVYEDGVTGASGSHAGIRGQVGYAASSVTDLEQFTWLDAVRNASFQGGSAQTNDEYMIENVKLEDGSYHVAYRFSLDGTNWKYCDSDSSENGFAMGQAGSVTFGQKQNTKSIGWCRIMNGVTEITSEVGGVSDRIYAQVFVEDCTHYQNHCADLKAEIGYGIQALTTEDALASQFKWSAAELNMSYDGSGGEKHDEFMGSVKAEEAGNYAILYRMSVDGGNTWTYCDTSDDMSFNAADSIKWTVGEPAANQIEWCRIQAPDKLEVRMGHDSDEVYGRVFVNGCTGIEGGCAGLKAQVGYGKKDAADASGFTYTDAVRNPSPMDAGANDEYAGVVTPTAVGEFGVAFRFSLDGQNWTYCDYDDDAGFNMARVVPMTVTEDKDTILWCRVKSPEYVEVAPGANSEEIYGQVWVKDCSEDAKKCESVKAQAGYGHISDGFDAFTYVDAIYNDGLTTGNNDEYAAVLAVPENQKTGEYDLIYRFSVDNGATWTYCDYDEIEGFDNARTAKLAVKEAAGLNVAWCQIKNVQPITSSVSEVSEPVYAEVNVPGCTDKDAACAELKAQVGYGAPGTGVDKIKDFTWSDAVRNDKFEGNSAANNDEYMGSVKSDTEGSYSVAYRFSVDGGANWTYCDTEDNNGFAADKMLSWTVSAAPVKKISWCQLFPTEAMHAAPGEKIDYYGQAFVEGCTEADGQCAGLKAWGGYGTAGDELDKFNFVDASFEKQVSDNDEFKASFAAPEAGDYQVVFAVSLDGGERVYCDTQDHQTFDRNAAGELKTGFVWGDGANAYKCGIDPFNESAEDNNITYTQVVGQEYDVYGQIYINGCTTANASCKNVVGAGVRYIKGKPSEIDYNSKAWYGVNGKLNPGFDLNKPNDEYMTSLSFSEAGSYYYVYTFELKQDPSNEKESAQVVYCYANWTEPGKATVEDLGVATINNK